MSIYLSTQLTIKCYNIVVKSNDDSYDMNFWQTLPKPFTVLAPLDGVTDTVFRQIITEVGKPDVLFTEFTACDGICSKGRARVAQRLKFDPSQQPIVAQIWGMRPEHFYETAKYVKELGFAGIDINMGCPHHTIVKQGACSALIKNPQLAGEIIQATKDGAGDLPVSVKTRIGFAHEHIDEWIGFILKQQIATLTVHLRTVAEMSQVPAHWELMPRVLQLRDTLAPETLIIGNGDVVSLAEMEEKYDTFGCDGFMVGRGIFANPWLFNKKIDPDAMTISDRITLYLRHIELFEKTWGYKNFAVLKKFCKTYIQNFPEASQLREKLMEAKTLDELRTSLLQENISL